MSTAARLGFPYAVGEEQRLTCVVDLRPAQRAGLEVVDQSLVSFVAPPNDPGPQVLNTCPVEKIPYRGVVGRLLEFAEGQRQTRVVDPRTNRIEAVGSSSRLGIVIGLMPTNHAVRDDAPLVLLSAGVVPVPDFERAVIERLRPDPHGLRVKYAVAERVGAHALVLHESDARILTEALSAELGRSESVEPTPASELSSVIAHPRQSSPLIISATAHDLPQLATILGRRWFAARSRISSLLKAATVLALILFALMVIAAAGSRSDLWAVGALGEPPGTLLQLNPTTTAGQRDSTSMPLSGLTAAAATHETVPPTPPAVPSLPATSSPSAAVQLRVIALADTSSGIVNLVDSPNLGSGDAIQIRFQASASCYLYVFWRGSSGRLDQIFPVSQYVDEALPLAANRWYYIPTANHPDGDWIEITGPPGEERIWFILSQQPESEILPQGVRPRGGPTSDGLSSRLAYLLGQGDIDQHLFVTESGSLLTGRYRDLGERAHGRSEQLSALDRTRKEHALTANAIAIEAQPRNVCVWSMGFRHVQRSDVVR